MFDLWLALGLGIITYVMRRLDYSAAGFLMAMVLAPIIETSFRRALIISGGDYTIFISRGYSQALAAIILSILAYAVFRTVQRARQARASPQET
jgi:putative tricarboxylic transport membrane protein